METARGRTRHLPGRGRRRRGLVPAVAACAALLAAGCAGSSAAGSASGPVTLGVATTLSGPFASYGVAGLNGIKLAVDDINSHGGLLGQKVQVASGDDQIDPATGETITRNLILHDHVTALFGSVSSAVAAAQEQLAEQYKVPIFFHLANDVSLTTTTYNKYAFEFVPNTDMEPAAAALYFARVMGHGPVRVATITPDYSFGLDTVKTFLADLRKDGVSYTVTSQQTPALGASSFTSQIAAILASNPQYVFAGQYGADLVTLTKQGLGLGLFSKAKVGGMYDLEVLQTLGAQAPAGAIAWDRAPFWTDDAAAMQNFVTAYKAAYHIYPSEFAITGYSAVQSWAWAVKKAGSFDAGKVSAALGGATVPTIRGNVVIRACDHQAEVPESVGTIAAAPDPKYGIRLWGPDVLTAQSSQIIEPCA
ncbi:MAG TPA: ABC transporter substrate-binding protein [Trebonia sp.]|nr:ABC transporter substrate-binding protein [Trebonia sp.]